MATGCLGTHRIPLTDRLTIANALSRDNARSRSSSVRNQSAAARSHVAAASIAERVRSSSDGHRCVYTSSSERFKRHVRAMARGGVPGVDPDLDDIGSVSVSGEIPL